MFSDVLKTQIKLKNSNICVGLDSDYEFIPLICKANKSLTETVYEFNKKIIQATADLVTVYKPNISFYAGYGLDGLKALQLTNLYIKENFPEIKIIIDCKRSEMLRSAQLAAKEIFEQYFADALIVTPWFGFDTIEPYTTYKNKAVFVLCHDSNPTAGEIQDVELKNGQQLFEHVTNLVNNKWNDSKNVLIEAPLTYPQILKKIYDISPVDQFFLIAGLGSQGGMIEDLSIFKTLRNFIVNASRSIIFASNNADFDIAARHKVLDYNSQINLLFK